MKKYIFALMGAISAFAATAEVEKQFNEAQTTEIQEIVRDYLLDNPQMLVEMQMALQNHQEDMQQEMAKIIVQDVTKNNNIPFFGDMDNAELVLIEFTDYACPFCRSMWPHTQRLLEEYKGKLAIKVINSPILGEYSYETAKIAQAIWQQNPEKWRSFQKELMVSRSNVPQGVLKKIVGSLDLDWDEVSTKAQSDEITAIVESNLDYANSVGLRGTPLYILSNGEIFNGAVGFDVLNQAIKKALEQNND